MMDRCRTLNWMAIPYEKFMGTTLAEFADWILKTLPKKIVGDICINELVNTASPNGLYFFFRSNKELQYIGKATSRSFIERIPSHFDPREGGWFNTLPKKIAGASDSLDFNEALKSALDLELALLGFADKLTAIKVESILRSFMEPTLNTGKSHRYNFDDNLKDLLKK